MRKASILAISTNLTRIATIQMGEVSQVRLWIRETRKAVRGDHDVDGDNDDADDDDDGDDDDAD